MLTMKRLKIYWWPAVIFCGLLSVLLIIGTDAKKGSDTEETEGGGDYHFIQRSFPYGKIDYAAQHDAATSFINNLQMRMSNTASWQFAGPVNIGGRISDIEMHPGNQQIAYLAAASGGVFKTTDAGSTWTPLFDNETTMSIGDIALAPSNPDIIYIGTGEANGGSGSLTYDANGVYKSLDGGLTWTNIGLQNTRMTGKMEIHPTNPDIAFAATMGDLFGKGPDRGLYRTTDGGLTWTKVLFVNDSTGAIDVVINPSNPNIVFAATWQRTRYADAKYYYGEQSGIWKSTDGGVTWTRLTGAQGLPPLGVNYSRIGLAIAKSNPQVVYAVYIDEFYNFMGLWKSTNSGTSWIRIDDPGNSSNVITSIYWEGKITVDPNDADVIYLTGLDLYKSDDGGIVFYQTITNAHVDHHAVAVHPLNSDFIMNGHDGGLNISYDGGNTSVHNETLPINQVYRLDIDYSQPTNLYCGLQDNGTVRTLTGQLNDYDHIFGGDGFQPLIDPVNNQIQFAQYQYGNLFKSTDGGFNWNSSVNGIFGSANWNTPLVFDPQNSQVMYYGSQRVFQSFDQGDNWVDISPDLTTVASTNLLFGTITSLDVSPLNSDIVYAGTDDGKVYRTLDGGANWTNVTGTLPQRWVTSIECDPFNQATAYVTLSGYRFHDQMDHVYKTTNNGNAWTGINGNLPDIPCNDIKADVMNAGVYYLATDAGVYFTANSGSNWSPAASGMPVLVCSELKIHQPSGTLVVGTYGRGLYKISLPDLLGIKEMSNSDVEFSLSPNPAQKEFTVYGLQFCNGSSLVIVDAKGNQVSVSEMKTKSVKIKCESWERGTYFIVLKKSGKQKVKKLVLI